MANKVKMKCAVCHKAFKSNNLKQTICDDCERKRRQEKTAPPAAKPAAAVAAKAAAGAKPTWLTQSVEQLPTPPAPFVPPPPRAPRPAVRAEGQPTGVTVSRSVGAPAPRPSGPARPSQKFAPKTPKPSAEPRPPRVVKPPPQPFAPAPEQIAAIEARYLELAQPEFDGIRSQIAAELSIPKAAVKRIIAALRSREHVPSWWELQTYTGTPEEMARIRTAYLPLLPVPPVGIHRLLAKELEMPSAKVYLGIRAIRDELHLPPFNPPESHPDQPAEAAPPAPVAETPSAS